MADSKKSDKDVTSVEMAKELEKRFSKYEGFSIRYIVNGSHEKFLSYDDAYVYIGSMNLLSYDGGEKENYKGLNFRFEGGILLNDKKFANERMEDFRSLMVPFDE
jgi:phosphatidylserine/phosphatidylglycerophosphate/cardiolipin synthase-like enzyme